MAREVLVTGATGTLGHRVVGEATEAGHKVRALSRRHHVGYTGVHWAQGDLLSGEGIDAAIHCATQGTRAKDVVSATNLISAARRAKTANIIHVSIVGIDRIPLPYYKTKLRDYKTKLRVEPGVADRQGSRRSSGRHRRARGLRPRRPRPHVCDVARQPSTGASTASARRHRRWFPVRRESRAGKSNRHDRLRRVPDCNYMTFLRLFVPSP